MLQSYLCNGNLIKTQKELGMVAHICNLNYSGGVGRGLQAEIDHGKKCKTLPE
jgi:hypothetical protein